MTLGIVAAEAYELAPYARRLSSCEGLGAIGRATVHGETSGGDTVRMTAFGPGFRAAARGAAAILAEGPVDVLISTGTCGALELGLRLGEIVVDPRDTQPRSAPPHRQGVIVSQDRVASTAAEKQALASEGMAVEMESAAVREAAARHQVRFACIKCVSDGAGETLALDFNRYRGADGRFQKGRIVAAMLARPFSRIPAILALEGQSRRAAQNLGGFLADCRF